MKARGEVRCEIDMRAVHTYVRCSCRCIMPLREKCTLIFFTCPPSAAFFFFFFLILHSHFPLFTPTCQKFTTLSSLCACPRTHTHTGRNNFLFGMKKKQLPTTSPSPLPVSVNQTNQNNYSQWNKCICLNEVKWANEYGCLEDGVST